MATVRENKVEIDNLKDRCDEDRNRTDKEFETVWKAINSIRNRSNLLLGSALTSAVGIIVMLVIKLVEMKNGS